MDRISEIFAQRRSEKRGALIIFAEAGYPTMDTCEQSIHAAIDAGADVIELGVPFSDPMADGRVISEASQQALANGMTLTGVLELVKRLRQRHPKTGIILFSYMNPMFSYGLEKLCQDLSQAGGDGILAVDLPYEERQELLPHCRANGLHLIPLISPLTDEERAAAIAGDATGFVYYVSVKGVTGVRQGLPPELAEHTAMVARHSKAPVAVGFGIATGEDAAAVAALADGVIVGSAFIKAAAESVNTAKNLVAQLRQGCDAHAKK